VLLAIIALGAFILIRDTHHVPPAVRPLSVAVAKAVRRHLSDQASFSGEFRPYQEIDLYAQVPGFVRSIRVDIGDRVQAGDVLATLEIPDLQDDLHQAEATLRHAASEIQRIQAEATDSAEILKRLKGVVAENPTLLPQQEIDTATAKASADTAALDSANNQRDVAKAELDRLHTTAAFCTITAPFSGVVSKRFADAGSFIRGGVSPSAPAMPLIRLSQNEKIRFIFPLPEVIAAKASINLPVDIRIGALDRTVPGKITRFTRHIDEATRTMDVEVDLDNADLTIIPGMFAVANITTEEKPDALSVPISAISQNAKQATVMLIDGNHHAHEQIVTLGLETPDYIEITSGLTDGDQVVIGSRPSVSEETVIEAHEIDAPQAAKP
jgi:RND family efflux transporter MFP subunit